MRRAWATLDATPDPHSNLRVVDAGTAGPPPSGATRSRAPRTDEPGWSVVDTNGDLRGQAHDRAGAVRLMSRLALKAHGELPLRVTDPQGQPTGDRLA